MGTDVRLVGGTRECSGKLEVKHQREWRAVHPHSEWNQEHSSVVCRQLGCGSAVSAERRAGAEELPAWMLLSACDGSEASLRACRGTTMRSGTASSSLWLVCSGNKLWALSLGEKRDNQA